MLRPFPSRQFAAEPPLEEHLAQSTLWPEIVKLYGHGNDLFCVAADPQGRYFASACKSQVTSAAPVLSWQSYMQGAEGRQCILSSMIAMNDSVPRPLLHTSLIPCFPSGNALCNPLLDVSLPVPLHVSQSQQLFLVAQYLASWARECSPC